MGQGESSEQINTVARSKAKGKQKAKKQLPRWEDFGEDDSTMIDPTDVPLEGESAMDENAIKEEDSKGKKPEEVKQTLGAAEQQASDAAEIAQKMLGSFEERNLNLTSQARATSSNQLATRADNFDGQVSDSEQLTEDVDTFENEAETLARLEELKLREKMLEEEQDDKDLMNRRDIEYQMNSVRASRVIVGMAKVKLKMVNTRMKMYDEAEQAGNEANRRARTLLTWTSILSVLQRFDERMRTPEILKAKQDRYLAALPPPPPPPPPEMPPDNNDEELHEKYEEMVQRYETKWKNEGRTVLGLERFEEIRNRAKGPAEKQKRLVADYCKRESKKVLSEFEYQDLLRKAWRLEDNHSSLDEYDPRNYARLVDAPGARPTS